MSVNIFFFIYYAEGVFWPQRSKNLQYANTKFTTEQKELLHRVESESESTDLKNAMLIEIDFLPNVKSITYIQLI